MSNHYFVLHSNNKGALIMYEYVWEKKLDETTKAYKWFCSYRDLGPERSLVKVAQNAGKGKNYKVQLERWSLKYDWVSRCEAYDTYLEGEKRASQEDAILEASRRHIIVAEKLMEKATARLKTLDPESMTPREVALFIDLAVRIKRDALGIANTIEVKSEVVVENKVAEELIKRTQLLLERG